MADGLYRIGIVGASSLVGKELAGEIENSLLATSSVRLLDTEEAAGTVAAAGEEAAVIQAIGPDSFEKLDFVFFAGSQDDTLAHWRAAREAGASLIDLSAALDADAGVRVRGPLAGKVPESAPDLYTPAVVAAHPAAVMLALVATRLQAAAPVSLVSATVFEPASQHGREAMDELHQQTVKLLSFESLPREQFDTQIAFNLLPALGEAAQVDFAGTAARIRRHYAVLGGKLPPLALALVQAPVFHGYTASVLVELDASLAAVEKALSSEGLDLVGPEGDPPSNLSAAGQEDVMVRVTEASPGRFWLWLAADNLKLHALNAIACALELRRLRPSGKVQ